MKKALFDVFGLFAFCVASFWGIAFGDEYVSTPVMEKPTVLVVAPPVFNESLRPWIEYRSTQGYNVLTLPLAATLPDGSFDYGAQTEPVATPRAIRAKILETAENRKIAAILLVGDGAPRVDSRYGWRDVVPAARANALVVQVFGSEDLIATDSYYADFDEDGVPDVPIGRFPAETPERLNDMIAKTLRYERETPPGNWTRRINIFAGPNGLDLRSIGSRPGEVFGDANPLKGLSSLVDSVVDTMARRMFSEYLPQEFSTSLTQCSLKSQFCPYPPDFSDVFLERINEGSLFFIYMGHGRVFGLDHFQPTADQDYGVFEVEDVPKLKSATGSPIALFFSCYAGAYDVNFPSLAEEVAASPEGPVAVVAASRLTAPYGMCVLGSCLMETAFASDFSGFYDEKKTLGGILLDAKIKALEPASEDAEIREIEGKESEDFGIDVFSEESEDEIVLPAAPDETGTDESFSGRPGERLEKLNRRLEKSLRDAEDVKRKLGSFRNQLDQTAAIFDPTASRLPDQIRDHILEFNLFGDPLLNVKFPQRIKIDAPEIAYSEDEFVVTGEVPSLTDREAVARVELLLADFRTPVKKKKRPSVFVENEESAKDYRETYREANKFFVDAVKASTKNGRFELRVRVPRDYSGESVVRVAAFDGINYYAGSSRVLIRPRTRLSSEPTSP